MAFSMYINNVDLPFLWNWVEWSVWLDVVSMLSVVLFGFAVIPDDASMMSIIKLPEAIFEDSFGHRKLSILVIDIFGFEMAKLIYAICFIASFHNIKLDNLWAFTKDGQLHIASRKYYANQFWIRCTKKNFNVNFISLFVGLFLFYTRDPRTQ